MARTGGPKPVLTPTVAKAVVKAVSSGLPFRFAAEIAGVAERTLYRWLQLGERAEDGPYRQLVQDIKRARAKGVQTRLNRITKAAKKNWTADAWVLERTYPEEYSTDRRELKELRKQIDALFAQIRGMAGAGGPETTDKEGPADDRPDDRPPG